ncbi:MerR family transcriptional regulator [Longispora albida]|uniref:MerR family transcriptional regulator n=1 Tax=Longispora albida TaxID=203523 RepID=UPI00037854D1|nr:MerR family transcriptional regulator [Longispora albida]
MGSRQHALRTADVARESGYSVQQIRNLEHDGVLPPVPRTASGYRTYTQVHVVAALAYRSFAAATGPVEARRLMIAAHHDPDGELLALLDAAHARLHAEREGLRLAQQAAAAISGEPVDDAQPRDSMTISELAAALDLRPSTLRFWEDEGLLAPGRAPGTPGRQPRSYSPADVRDARIVQQLRQAGYRIPQLRAVMPRLIEAGGREEVAGALAARQASLSLRSRQLVTGAAVLESLLSGTAEKSGAAGGLDG